MHLEEAKEMCPEGHEMSESYQAQGLHATPSGMHYFGLILLPAVWTVLASFSLGISAPPKYEFNVALVND